MKKKERVACHLEKKKSETILYLCIWITCDFFIAFKTWKWFNSGEKSKASILLREQNTHTKTHVQRL